MSSGETTEFLRVYEAYVRHTLVPIRDGIKGLFQTWKEPTYWARHVHRGRLPVPSPIQRAFPRIKRPESVVDKILRKAEAFPDGLSIASVRRMQDAIAARVVVYFLANLPLIHRELLENESLEISVDDPPIAYLNEDLARRMGLGEVRRMRKDSGYASVHYTVRFKPNRVRSQESPWFEIQVRTLAEDLWGEIEHILGYKPEKRTSFAVRKQFQILSAELAAIDEHFNLLFEELSRFQEEVKYPDTNPLNAENLPPVLNDLGITCAQKEIDGLLKLLSSRGFGTVGDLREEASPRRLEIVRNSFRGAEGREPGNFEVVAAIAAIRGIGSESDITAAVRDQVAFLEAWLRLRRELD